MTEQNDQPIEASDIFDNIEEVKEAEIKENVEETGADKDYYIVRDGEKEIPIPKKGKVKLSTKAGDEMEISVQDWADAPWSKRESSRLVNEKRQLEQHIQNMAHKYEDLEAVLMASPEDIKGSAWTAQALKSLYNLNPHRAQDIKEFVESVRQGTIDSNEIKASEIARENVKLKRQASSAYQQLSSEELSKYSSGLSNQLMDTLGVDAAALDSKVSNLLESGKVAKVQNRQGLDHQATIIYGEILIDKAEQAIKALGLNQEEVEAHKNDIVGLLYANPKQSSSDLVKKLGPMIGKVEQISTAERAKKKVENFKTSTGRRPESITPKPLKDRDRRGRLDPIDLADMELGL